MIKNFKIDKLSVFFAFLFWFTLLAKCILFISYVDHFPINIVRAWRMHALYFGVCGIIASFSLLFKRKGWIIVFSFLLDIWLVSNLLYFRAFNDFLDVFCIYDIQNMEGIWSSIIPLFSIKDLLFPCLTFLLCLELFVVLKRDIQLESNWKLFITYLIVSVILIIPKIVDQRNSYQKFRGDVLTYNIFNKQWSSPEGEWLQLENIQYIKQFTPILYFIFECNQLSYRIFQKEKPLECISIPEISSLINTSSSITEKPSNVLIIFFESLESWCIGASIDGQMITPNINAYTQLNNSLFCSSVVNQTKGGLSSDAQVLINTGLCPVQKGSVANQYNENYFFCLSKAGNYKFRKTYVGTSKKMWNQDRLTKSFGYSSLYAKPVSDKAMYNMICDELDTIRQPFFIQAVTMGSHTPFEAYKDSSDLKIPTNLPELLKNYLKCINYTDKAISGLLRKIQEDKNLSNTTLIIMGDHTIFGPEKRSKLIDACKKVNLPLSINKAFVPLIINSQNINKHIQISDTVYQMDVYPTILHLIPNNGFYWKGLGVNLLDKNTRNHRIIKSSQAYQISDKIIRSNYFYKVLPK